MRVSTCILLGVYACKYVYFDQRVLVLVCVCVGDVPPNNRNGFRPLVLHDDDDGVYAGNVRGFLLPCPKPARTHNPLIPDGSIP